MTWPNGGIHDLLAKAKTRSTMVLGFNYADLIFQNYERMQSDPELKKGILQRLDCFLNFCDVISRCKSDEDIKKTMKKYNEVFIICGFKEMYPTEKERKEIIRSVKKYRKPFDEIKEGKKLNLEEMAEGVKFFVSARETAELKLEYVRPEDLAPPY